MQLKNTGPHLLLIVVLLIAGCGTEGRQSAPRSQKLAQARTSFCKHLDEFATLHPSSDLSKIRELPDKMRSDAHRVDIAGDRQLAAEIRRMANAVDFAIEAYLSKDFVDDLEARERTQAALAAITADTCPGGREGED
jgi:hypothetical protein